MNKKKALVYGLKLISSINGLTKLYGGTGGTTGGSQGSGEGHASNEPPDIDD